LATYFTETTLLRPPTERAAFSDRQAYVCAELSRLAYFRFEGGHTVDEVIAAAKAVLGDDSRVAILEAQIRAILPTAPNAAAEGKAALKAILNAASFNLVDTFSESGTQAFVASKTIKLDSGASKTIAFLVFRGTEPKDFRDIKADINASLVATDIAGERVELHKGYLTAFGHVQKPIDRTLTELTYDQLFITGHSLGGALAMVATAILGSSVNGACYTFGAPPIGTEDVQNKLKTPIYEIINEVDIVPRLPNPWMATFFIVLLKIIRLAAKSVTILNRVLASGTWDERLENFIESMTRYRHPGYMSYLVGAGSGARLRFNVSGFDRLKWWLSMMWKRGFGGVGRMASDHSIDQYVAKLKEHALKRQ
jgi:triacylglycerol lipase